jgi:adenylate cyclase class 2
MLEIEAKIRIENPEEMARILQEKGAELVRERYFEENTLWDFPARTLTKNQQALRLRKIKKRAYLTFKGAQKKSRQFKIRDEFETEVRNTLQMKKILKSLGLIPSFQYQKYRTVFRTKNLTICLDELPIGNFIECEGERNHIVRFIQSLGFSRSDFIKKDYISLLIENKTNK